MSKKEKGEMLNTSTPGQNSNNSLTPDMITLKWQPHPASRSYIPTLISDLLEWAIDEKIEALRVTDFCAYKGMYRQDMWNLMQKYPALSRAWEEAKNIIGSRRERGALKKHYDAGTMKWGQHNYGDEWASYDKYHSDLKKDDFKDTILNFLVRPDPKSDAVNRKLAEIAAKKKEKKSKK